MSDCGFRKEMEEAHKYLKEQREQKYLNEFRKEKMIHKPTIQEQLEKLKIDDDDFIATGRCHEGMQGGIMFISLPNATCVANKNIVTLIEAMLVAVEAHQAIVDSPYVKRYDPDGAKFTAVDFLAKNSIDALARITEILEKP